MAKSISKYIICGIVLFLAFLAILGTDWATLNYSFESFDQVIYTLMTSVTSASDGAIKAFIVQNVIPALIIVIIIILSYILLKKFTSNSDIWLNFKIRNKNVDIKINHSKFSKLLVIITPILLFLYAMYYMIDKLYIVDFIKNNVEKSTFIEEYYVDPTGVEISFPDEKRNLIYIFLESMEGTFTSYENGGAFEENYIEELTDLANQYINFSANELIGGANMYNGTTWTMGGMIAQTAGIPLKIAFSTNAQEGYANGLVKGAYTLGDILDDAGYNQHIMVGSKLDFGGRRVYFEQHGKYQAFDYFTAIEDGLIDEDYYVFWGYEDELLFQYAKEKLTEISKEDEPFNFTMLTVDTHAPDGYMSDWCEEKYDNQYLNAVACSSKQVGDFIEWIQDQDFYENTTIVITGDHLSMNNYSFDTIDEDYNRSVYNVYINSAIDTDCSNNRMFSVFDYYPTTLAALGVDIKGNKLGLGTNLFSCKKTLDEQFTYYHINSEITKTSTFYNNCINFGFCN